MTWTAADVERLRVSESRMTHERYCCECGTQVEPVPECVQGRLPEQCRLKHGNATVSRTFPSSRVSIEEDTDGR